MRRRQARKDDNPQKIPQEDADEGPRRAALVAYRRWLLRRPLPALTKMLHLKAVERHLADPDGSADSFTSGARGRSSDTEPGAICDGSGGHGDLARQAVEGYRRFLEETGAERGS